MKILDVRIYLIMRETETNRAQLEINRHSRQLEEHTSLSLSLYSSAASAYYVAFFGRRTPKYSEQVFNLNLDSLETNTLGTRNVTRLQSPLSLHISYRKIAKAQDILRFGQLQSILCLPPPQ